MRGWDRPDWLGSLYGPTDEGLLRSAGKAKTEAGRLAREELEARQMSAAQPIVQPYNGGRSPLELADNTTTQGAFEQQNAMRRAAEEAMRRGQPTAQPSIAQPQPVQRPAPVPEPYVSPFGTKPMTDEEYRALPKPASPRSALDQPLMMAQGPSPDMLGSGAAERAGSALRGRTRQLETLEGEALGKPDPFPLDSTIPMPTPTPSFFDRLFKPKPKAQPLRLIG